MKNKIEIGSKVELLEDVDMGYFLYKKGHRFKVIDEGERGFDLEDSEGHRLYETRFVKMKLVNIVKERKRKLKKTKGYER